MNIDMSAALAKANTIVARPKPVEDLSVVLLRKANGLLHTSNVNAEFGQIMAALPALNQEQVAPVMSALFTAVKERDGLNKFSVVSQLMEYQSGGADEYALKAFMDWDGQTVGVFDPETGNYAEGKNGVATPCMAVRYLAGRNEGFLPVLAKLKEDFGAAFDNDGYQVWPTTLIAGLYGPKYCAPVFNPAHNDRHDGGTLIPKTNYLAVRIPEEIRNNVRMQSAGEILRNGGKQNDPDHPLAHTGRIQPDLNYLVCAGMTNEQFMRLLNLMLGYARCGVYALDMRGIIGRLVHHKAFTAGVGIAGQILKFLNGTVGEYGKPGPGIEILKLLSTWALASNKSMGDENKELFDVAFARFKDNLGIKKVVQDHEPLLPEEPLPVANKKANKKADGKKGESNDHRQKPRAPKPEVNDRRLRRQEDDEEDEGGVGASSGEGVAPSLPRQVVVNNAMATQLAALGLAPKK